MTPPIRLYAQVSQPTGDPLHPAQTQPQPAPTETVAEPPPAETEPTIRPVSQPADSAEPPAQESPPPERRTGPSALHRWHATVWGGYQIPHSYPAEGGSFASAAPSYDGPDLRLTGAYSVVDGSLGDVRVGLGLGYQYGSGPRITGASQPSVHSLSLFALAEGNINFGTPHIGLGLDVLLGYKGYMGGNVDVGVPFSASFDWAQQGGFYIGTIPYFHFWQNAFRLGAALDFVPTGFGLPAGTGNPDLRITHPNPEVTVILGADILRIIDNAQGN